MPNACLVHRFISGSTVIEQHNTNRKMASTHTTIFASSLPEILFEPDC